MKMRKIYSAILALALALSLSAPALAGEGEVPQPEEQNPVQTPEPPAEEVPGWLLEPEGGEQTAETPADPAVPETPEIPVSPENLGESLPPAEPETPETPEMPEVPEVPEVPENPGQPSEPEIPETPENPENPETPSVPALPPESPIAEEEPPVIEVLVPSAGQVIINPYCLPVELDGQTATDQIVSAPLILENHSTIPVSVSASVTGTVPPGSGVYFAAAPPMPDSPVKEIFLYAEFHAVPEPAFQPSWSGLYSDSTNQLLVGFQSAAKADVMRLEAGGTACSWGAMRLFGSAAVSPMVPWQAGDDIQATFVFSFTPIVEAPAADVPVTDEPVVDMPAADEPAADIAVPGEFAGPLPDADPGAEELSVPGWLFPN
ncbi:MAG: hypothetical protein K2P26_04010 [Oscillospiraceae bacterium]|nr:hypothetical protein [Oscillospiraceae bacterium]